MGLDNGITMTQVSKIIKENYDIDFDTELCCWRKCYDIRDLMIETIGKDRFNDNEPTMLTIEDVKNFRAGLIEYMTQSYTDWYEDCYSRTIWSYEECMRREGRHIGVLSIIITVMEHSPGAKVWFDDSY